MKRLILMRHAKSDYPTGVADHERPLNRRGRLASALMGAWLCEVDALPDLAYVSAAARAQETWSRMVLDRPMETRPDLYHADAETMLDVARGAPEVATSLMLLWHEPGVGDAANRLIGAREIDAFPTAKIVLLDVRIETWPDLVFGGATLAAEASPKTIV